MAHDFEELKFVRAADVHKGGVVAGHLSRTGQGGVSFSYAAEYLTSGLPSVASSLPLTDVPVETPAGALPPFFAGLLPEGHRLSVLRDATKTSLDDELTLLLAVGADAPGDVQVVPAGEIPTEPAPLADTSRPEELDFAALANAVDRHAIPGMQDKASASMLTTPLSLRGQRYLLKIDPPNHAHLLVNEALHLSAAKALKLPVAKSRVITDMHGLTGLLVERFDRVQHRDRSWVRLPMEDGAQVMGLPPASKYSVTSEEVAAALAEQCKAPLVASRNLYLQFVFAWLSGKTKNLKAKHWADFASNLGLPQRAATAANALALSAAGKVKLEDLTFSGSPLRGALRELRFRRGELAG